MSKLKLHVFNQDIGTIAEVPLVPSAKFGTFAGEVELKVQYNKLSSLLLLKQDPDA